MCHKANEMLGSLAQNLASATTILSASSSNESGSALAASCSCGNGSSLLGACSLGPTPLAYETAGNGVHERREPAMEVVKAAATLGARGPMLGPASIRLHWSRRNLMVEASGCPQWHRNVGANRQVVRPTAGHWTSKPIMHIGEHDAIAHLCTLGDFFVLRYLYVPSGCEVTDQNLNDMSLLPTLVF